MRRSKRRIVFLLMLILALLFGLILYLTYFQIFEAPEYRESSINMRNWIDETQFGRGVFYDRNGHEIVVREKNEDGAYSRYSQHPNMYSHVIGYNSPQYGKSGLESTYNAYLLNIQDNPIAKLRGQILDQGVGNDIYLSLDHDLQYLAYTALEGHKGAIVAMNPKTGEILAMVSMPGFNVNSIDEDWNDLIEDEDSPLYNRATMGLYPPGSTMKAVSGFTFFETGIDLSYNDQGETTINGFTYSNYDYASYGQIGLREALIHSSNVYFADKSTDISGDDFLQTASRFYFNRSIPFDLGTSPSRAEYMEGMDINEKASNSFGQGRVLASPLQMAMVYSSIANGGVMMKPYLVESIKSISGRSVYRAESEALSRVSEPDYVERMKAYLIDTMEENDSSARVEGYIVAGKTGTAENESGLSHAWYCGFAPAEDPQIALAIILESEGVTGGEGAAPIAGELFDYWLNQKTATD